MKNYKNYVSLIIMLLIMCGILIAVNNVNESNNLSTTPPTTTDTPQKEPFIYTDSRVSTNLNIEFENNFGGSNNENVFKVFKLNNYYIIGITNSTDKYFENNLSTSLYVMITNNEGKVLSVKTMELNSTSKIIDAKIFRNDIYILTEFNGAKLISYNFTTNDFDIAFFDSNPNCELIISSEPMVAIKEENTTKIYYLLNNVEKTYNISIKNIVMSCDYSNGTLIMFNGNNTTIIGLITLNSFTVLKQIENSTLHNINITNKHFVLALTKNNSTQILILDYDFNTISTTTLPLGTNITMFEYKNEHYITLKNSNTLKQFAICEHGTITNEIILKENIKNYHFQLNNNNMVIITTTLNNLVEVTSYNVIGEIKNNVNFGTISNFNINAFELDDNSSYIIIGNFSLQNNIITSNYGNLDIFISKITTFN